MSHASDRRHIDQLLAWLRERELDFELAARSAGLGVWQWNLRTDRVVWSARCRELLGVEAHVAPSLQAFLAVVHPDDRAQLIADAALARKTPLTRDQEYRIVLPDGSLRWLRSAWRTHMDHRTGTPVQALGVILDATERQGRDDGHRQELESQARLWAEAFLNNTRGIAVGDPTGQTLKAVNPAYASLLGWTPAELEGRPILGLYPATEHPRLIAAMRTADERGVAGLETCQLHRDGTLIPVELSLVAVRDGAGRLTSGIATVADLRDRLRMEGELRNTETQLMASERFRELTDSAPVGVLLTDTDRACSYANPCWQALSGLPMEDARDLGWWDAIHPEDRGRVTARWDDLARGVEFDVEFRYRRRSGDVCWVHSRANPLRNGHGDLTGYILVDVDITEKVQHREAVDRSHARVRALAHRLEHLREEERDRYARKLHGTLRQDLTSLTLELGALQALLPAAGERTRMRLEQVTALADRCLESLRRLAFELHPPGIEDLGFPAAVRRYAEECAAEAGLDIEVAVPESLPELGRRSAIALYRTCQEALPNVIRHARAKKVEVSLSAQDGLMRLRISDDGIGIGEADRDKPRSFGLLAAAERLNELGGALRVFGVDGQGTTLDASVPLRRPPE